MSLLPLMVMALGRDKPQQVPSPHFRFSEALAA